MKAIRKDYLKRLIEGVRYVMENDPEMIQAKAVFGDEATPSKWLDATLLCKVIEDEILNDQDA